MYLNLLLLMSSLSKISIMINPYNDNNNNDDDNNNDDNDNNDDDDDDYI